MEEVKKNIKTFLEILQIGKSESVIHWDESNFKRAQQWAQYAEELPECCDKKWSCTKCSPCYSYLVTHGLNTIKNGIGGVGMFFSFTLFVGVVMAFRYRHQKDPRANPSAFL